VEEAQAMSGGVSPSTGRRYPLTMVCAVFRVARSTVYAAPSPRPAGTLGKRGPKTATSDVDLVGAIRAVLAATPFHGEGYLLADMRKRGILDRPPMVTWGSSPVTTSAGSLRPGAGSCPPRW